MHRLSGMLDGAFTAPSTAPQHPSFSSGGHQTAVAHVNVTAISGATPSATVVLEDSSDGANWAQLATQTITTTGVYALRSGAGPIGEFVRIRLSALSGTSPTISMQTKGAVL